MTDEQLAFFRALCAPFENNQVSDRTIRGKQLFWVDARIIENRLDEICGPAGWKRKYKETAHGYKCRLSLRVPTEDGTWQWIAKEDGGGPEGMESSKDKPDVDNDDKSAYTNSFRRAAQTAWGIGRYLYEKGVPSWLQDDDGTHKSSTEAHRGPQSQTAEKPHAAGKPESGHRNGEAPNFDNFRVPRAGKAVFAWAKALEAHFQTTLIGGMIDECKKLGVDRITDLDQAGVDQVCAGVIDFCRGLDVYKGEFDAPAAPAKPLGNPGAGWPTKPSSLHELRKRVADLATKLIFIMTKEAPSVEYLRDQIDEVSRGTLARPIGSLRGCNSEADLLAVAAEFERLIAAAQRPANPAAPAVAVAEAVDDIPF